MRNALTFSIAALALGAIPALAQSVGADRAGPMTALESEYKEPPFPCPNCRFLWAMGEYAPPTGKRVVTPSPTCKTHDDAKKIAMETAQVAAAALEAGAHFASGDVIGGLPALLDNPATKNVIAQESRRHGGDFWPWMDRNFGATTDKGNCVVAMAIFPGDVKVVDYRLKAYDPNNVNARNDCPKDGRDCGFGFAKYLDHNVVVRNGVTIVSATFMNWSDNNPRQPSIIVAYLPTGEQAAAAAAPHSVPNGQECFASSDCMSSQCYPGPGAGNTKKYCIGGEKNCALPGTDGVVYGYAYNGGVCKDPKNGNKAQILP